MPNNRVFKRKFVTRTATRRYRAEILDNLAPKNKQSFIKTVMLVGLINKHKKNELNDDHYFDRLVKIVTKDDDDGILGHD